MVDVKTIEKMYTSLWRGYKDYRFSQLRSALREYNVTDLDSLKLNLKGDREALLKIAEKFLMNALDSGVHGVRDNNSQENDYPNIPLTYGWQFEGVDDSKDCFLYPTTPLTCDVLSGQCCELSMVTNNVYDDPGNVAATIVFGDPIVSQPNKVSIQLNRSKSTVSNKGFGQIKPIQVKSAVIPMPYIGDIAGYHPENQKSVWLDLDDLTENLEVAFSPEIEEVKTYAVLPINGKYKDQTRRAIEIESSTKIVKQACELGNWNAKKLYQEMIEHGTKELRIKDAVLVDGRVIPRDAEGNLLEEFAFDTTLPNLLLDNWLLAENYLSYSPETDDGDKSNLPFVVNLVMASISRRRDVKLASFEIKRYEAIGLLRQIYPEFCDNVLVEKLSRAMQRDDELYRDSCQEILFEVRKKAIITPYTMPDFIKECSEVRSIIESKTNKDPSITLINGWLHPLSEVSEGIPGTDGEPYCNAWQFASMIVGAATGRCPNADSDSAIRILIDFDVIESESSVALEQAKSDDAIYLQLVGAMKEAFEVDIEKQLNRLD